MIEVWRDSKGNVAYIKGVAQSSHGGMNRWEFEEAKDMQSGSVMHTESGFTWHPPFTKCKEIHNKRWRL